MNSENSDDALLLLSTLACMYIYTASPVLKPTLTRLLAIVGSELTLECPYELGTTSDHIDPYHHIWFIHQPNNEIPQELSRTLNVSITNQSPSVTDYTCALRMWKCSAMSCGVEVTPSLNKPQLQLTKVGKFIYLLCNNIIFVAVPLSIDVALVSQTVSAGSLVTFECAANGTSIEIIWMYNGDTFTADDANVTTSRIGLAYVRSILELSSPSSSGFVICIVRQSFDGTILLNNNDFYNCLPEQITSSTARLLVTTSDDTTMPTTSTATGIGLCGPCKDFVPRVGI